MCRAGTPARCRRGWQASRAGQAESIISKILSDEALNLGQQGDPELPKDLVEKLTMFRKVYDFMVALLFLFLIFLTVAVTYCI